MSDDRHRCLSGRQCRFATMEVVDGEKQRVLPLTEKPDTLCTGCISSLRRFIDEAPETWLSLQEALGDRSMRAGEKVSGTKSPPIPIDVEVDAAKEALTEWLIAAAARVAETMGVDDPQPKSRTDDEQHRIIDACTRLVAPNVDRLLDSPMDAVTVWRRTGESTTFVDMSGVDIALELDKVNTRIRRILGTTTPKQWLSLYCPDCDTKTLYRTVDVRGDGKVRDEVSCATCQLSWPYERYSQLCLIVAKEDEMQRAELEKQLADERLRSWLTAESLWKECESWRTLANLSNEHADRLRAGFEAALDPRFASMPVSEFAKEVLQQAS